MSNLGLEKDKVAFSVDGMDKAITCKFLCWYLNLNTLVFEYFIILFFLIKI